MEIISNILSLITHMKLQHIHSHTHTSTQLINLQNHYDTKLLSNIMDVIVSDVPHLSMMI